MRFTRCDAALVLLVVSGVPRASDTPSPGMARLADNTLCQRLPETAEQPEADLCACNSHLLPRPGRCPGDPGLPLNGRNARRACHFNAATPIMGS